MQNLSKYGVFSGPYFPAFGLKQRDAKARTRKNSVIGHFSHNVYNNKEIDVTQDRRNIMLRRIIGKNNAGIICVNVASIN